jgi:hypothetical protein
MDTVNSIKKLIRNLNNKRLLNHRTTASNEGFLGVSAPGNNEQHVNHGTFTVRNINNRIVMNFLPNNPINRANVKFRNKGAAGAEYSWKWANVVQWSNWTPLNSHDRGLFPNIRPVAPGTPRR